MIGRCPVIQGRRVDVMACYGRLCVCFDRLQEPSGSLTSAMPDENMLSWFTSSPPWVAAIPIGDASTRIDSYRSSASEMLDDSIVAAIVRMAKKTTRAAKTRRTFAITLALLSENMHLTDR